MNNTDVQSMVEEFLTLEVMEENLAKDGYMNKAQKANERKWKVKKLARIYGVEKEFSTLLKELRINNK